VKNTKPGRASFTARAASSKLSLCTVATDWRSMVLAVAAAERSMIVAPDPTSMVVVVSKGESAASSSAML
jgi:hypothetical protein